MSAAEKPKKVAQQKPNKRIPGYTGHVRGLKAENFYGKSFLSAQRAAANPSRVDEFCPEGRVTTVPENLIPGYMGHLPGRSENVIGTGFVKSKLKQLDHLAGNTPAAYQVSSQLQEPSKELLTGRAGSEIPAYTGYIPGVKPESHVMGATKRNINDRAHVNRGLDATHRHRHLVPPKAGNPEPRTNHKAPHHVIPGYMGHMRGQAETIIGKINQEAHREAYLALGIPHEAPPRDPDIPKEPPVHPRVKNIPHKAAVKAAISVPGYMGHIPGRESHNVFGKTFQRANYKSAMEKFAPDGYEGRTESYPNSAASLVSTASRTESKASKDGRTRPESRLSPSMSATEESYARRAAARDEAGGSMTSLPSSGAKQTPMSKSSVDLGRTARQAGDLTARATKGASKKVSSSRPKTART